MDTFHCQFNSEQSEYGYWKRKRPQIFYPYFVNCIHTVVSHKSLKGDSQYLSSLFAKFEIRETVEARLEPYRRVWACWRIPQRTSPRLRSRPCWPAKTIWWNHWLFSQDILILENFFGANLHEAKNDLCTYKMIYVSSNFKLLNFCAS